MTPTLCVCVCVCMRACLHACMHAHTWACTIAHHFVVFCCVFSSVRILPLFVSLQLSQSLYNCIIHATNSYITCFHFLSRVCHLLLWPCLLLWQHFPTVMKAKFQKGLQTSCKHHLLFPLHPKHRWQKGSFLLHVEHHLPSKLPQWHKTRDNGVMLTSLMNRRITKFLYNQQAVDLSRMSTQMTKKDIAQSDWIIPEIVQWKMWRKCRREQEQPSALSCHVSA